MRVFVVVLLFISINVFAQQDTTMFSTFRIKVKCNDSTEQWGTAFYYKDKVITAAHVTEGGNAYFIEFGKAWHEVELLKSNFEADVSVLKLKSEIKIFTPINLKEEKHIKEGDSIHAFMGIDGQPIVHNHGTFVNKQSDIGSYLSIIKIQSNQGASGSAILTDENKVVGMLIQGYVLPWSRGNKTDKKEWAKLFRLKEVTKAEDVKNYWQIVPIKIINEVIKNK